MPAATCANSACGVRGVYGVREACDDTEGASKDAPRSQPSPPEGLTPHRGVAQVRAPPSCALLARSTPKAATFHPVAARRRRRRVLCEKYRSPLLASARRHRRACTLKASASQAAFCASHSSTWSMHRWHSAPCAGGPAPAMCVVCVCVGGWVCMCAHVCAHPTTRYDTRVRARARPPCAWRKRSSERTAGAIGSCAILNENKTQMGRPSSGTGKPGRQTLKRPLKSKSSRTSLCTAYNHAVSSRRESARASGSG
jgi:hypothetical protein